MTGQNVGALQNLPTVEPRGLVVRCEERGESGHRLSERLVKAAANKCYVKTSKRKLEDTTAGAELKERFEALQKRSKVEFDEWEKSPRPLLDGGEGKIGYGGTQCVVSGTGQRTGESGSKKQAERRERHGSGSSGTEMASA